MCAGAARLAGLVAARRDRLAEAQLAAMPEDPSDEIRAALLAVASDLACGRLPVEAMG